MCMESCCRIMKKKSYEHDSMTIMHYRGTGQTCPHNRKIYNKIPVNNMTLFGSFHFTHFKGPYADHILIPQGSTGSSTFFDIKWKPIIFLVANPKFQLQILCSFEDITKYVKLNGIPENNFLCIFIIASSPGVHTFFCLWRVNKKLPQGETSQNAFQKSSSIN